MCNKYLLLNGLIQQIKQQLEDANYQIEKFIHFVEKLKKSLSSLSKCEGLLSLSICNEEYNKPTKDKSAKRMKEEVLQHRSKVIELTKMILPNVSQLEKERLVSDTSTSNACIMYSKLVKLGYTDKAIHQAVYNATRDVFWSKQFRTLMKLHRKNKDEVYYIDVFLAINAKATKVNIPRVVR